MLRVTAAAIRYASSSSRFDLVLQIMPDKRIFFTPSGHLIPILYVFPMIGLLMALRGKIAAGGKMSLPPLEDGNSLSDGSETQPVLFKERKYI